MRVVNAPKLIMDALLQCFLPLARRRLDTAQAQINRFDMLPGKDVKWWGAIGDDVNSFLGGKVISNAKLSGLYKNASLQLQILAT